MKYCKWLMLLLMLFLPTIGLAYDYVNEENKSSVLQSRQSIYDLDNLYENFFPTPEDSGDGYNGNTCGSSKYFWPIGSDKTTHRGKVEFAIDSPNTVNITSWFGGRKDPFTGQKVASHGALDIAPSANAGTVNVIAAQSGTVTVANKGCQSYGSKSCGGGFGNYIVIKHDDGNYTYYAHLHQNSLKVKVGDKVSQGQVIAKVGSSGRSTGTHLHFEVREGTNTSSARVDPLNYVDPKKPRPDSGEDCTMPKEFINMILIAEGGKTDGDYYVAEDIGDGTKWTIGPGLTPSVGDAFKKYGINPNTIHIGTKLKKDIVNQVFAYVMTSTRKQVEKELSKSGISMNNNQILAITSGAYNGGQTFTNNVIKAYKQNGNTYKVFGAFCSYVHNSGRVWPGLVTRRKVEWILYSSGIYVDQHKQSTDNSTECIGNFNIPNSEKKNISKMLTTTSEKYKGHISYY